MDEAGQALGVLLHARRGHHHAAPANQRQEDLIDGDIKGQRCLEQGGIIAAEEQDLIALPEQALHDRTVADHCALWAAGAARGKDDVRNAVRGRRGEQLAGGIEVE